MARQTRIVRLVRSIYVASDSESDISSDGLSERQAEPSSHMLRTDDAHLASVLPQLHDGC